MAVYRYNKKQKTARQKSKGICWITVNVESAIFQQYILQRQMESLALSTTAQLDKISLLLSSHLQTYPNLSKSNIILIDQKRFADQILIQTEINALKWNLNKITSTCQSLQNENRVLKRMVIRSDSSSSMYSVEKHNCPFHIDNSLLNKYLSKVTSSHYSNDFQTSFFQQNPSQINFLNSSRNLDQIKQEVNGLSQNLKSIQKAYEKYDLDSTDDHQVKDMFLNESSLIRFGSKSASDNEMQTSREEINLENLLCNEELSFDEMSLQQKSHKKSSSENVMVQSLIAKGIQFRESRAMRSKEYQTLSDRIQQYRDQIKNKENLACSKIQTTSKYR